MSSCDVAPLKVDSGGSSWSWATLHQLLSTAADYGGHDVVMITEKVLLHPTTVAFSGDDDV